MAFRYGEEGNQRLSKPSATFGSTEVKLLWSHLKGVSVGIVESTDSRYITLFDCGDLPCRPNSSSSDKCVCTYDGETKLRRR